MLTRQVNKRIMQNTVLLGCQQQRLFSAVDRLDKMELTIRTPYRTIFANYADFQRIIVQTQEGQMTIGNRTYPRVYLLPPSQMHVRGLSQGTQPGKNTETATGDFVHTGGWMHVHA